MRLTELKTIPELARAANLNRYTLHRRLLRLHRKYGGDWLVRPNRNILVNPAALRAAHPGVFDPPDLATRVADLEDRAAETERDIHTVVQAVGATNRRLDLAGIPRAG